jgi:hypothetical protein
MRDTVRHIFEITLVGAAVMATVILLYGLASMLWSLN